MSRISISCFALFMALMMAACGSSDSSDVAANPPEEPTPQEPQPPVVEEPQCDVSFDSTFAAIQTTIFERHSCNQAVCHGSSAAGGLDLSTDVAYDNLYNQPGQIAALSLVQPGRGSDSLLYLKLAAATDPEHVDVAGAPMPSGGAPLSAKELELMRLWIYAGAPREGVIENTVALVDGCMAEPTPITIEPLAPLAPGEGVQFVMPPFRLPAGTEVEVCFASYYDFTDQVPVEFQDPTGTMFRYKGFDMRQDPQSHHLILFAPNVPLDRIHDPAFGGWYCRGGAQDGEECEPTDVSSCGEGMCATKVGSGGCRGFGPPDIGGGVDPADVQGFGGAQRAQLYTEFGEGVYAEVAMKGLVYWNSHAFNLTAQDHQMNARLNYFFADKQDHVSMSIPVHFRSLFQASGTPPYTEQRYCNELVFAKGTRITQMTQHTHRFGKHFEAWMPDGTKFYENFVYNDPVVARFDPAIHLDSDDVADRTFKFCGLFNNGLAADGSPDPETVTRSSRTPQNQLNGGGACTPTACAAGRIGAACSGVDDNATCDSSPGAGDGDCDACAIQAGTSTENSMFLLLGRMYVE
ncbi:MAG: hypothetical protein VCC00_04700 [Deltaproteobacteria bacterium]